MANEREDKRLLVFSSVGDSCDAYESWLPGREYTVAVAYYGDSAERFGTISEKVDLCFWSRGSKFQNFYRFGSRGRYDCSFVVDDDIEISSGDIMRCFRLMAETGAPVGSPAHDPQGRISWPIMVAPRRSCLRISNFVEMTAMFLSREAASTAMRAYAPYRELLVGWGIDFIISSACYTEAEPFVIFDEVRIVNPRSRRGGGREIERLQSRADRSRAWESVRGDFGQVRPAAERADHLLRSGGLR